MSNRDPADRIWQPQEGPQTAAITCPVHEICYGGARGGGKTDWLIGDFAVHAARYGENAVGILFRRTIPEFREIRRRSLQIYTPLGWTFHRQERTWTAPNGATLFLCYLFDEADAANYQGHSYTWVGVDEAGNFPNPAAIDLMRGTMRSAEGVPVRLCLTANPGGVGHHWVKERYIDPSAPMKPFMYKPQPEELPNLEVQAVFIPAVLDDNKILMENDPTYEARLAAAGGPALFKAWRYGDWDAIVGQALSEWRRDVHVVAAERLDKNEWSPTILGGDWGYNAPGGFVGYSCGPDGEVYVSWEYYFNDGTVKRTAEEIGYDAGLNLRAHVMLHRVPDYPRFMVLDSAAWAEKDGRGGSWTSIADMLQRGFNRALGEDSFPIIPCSKTKNSRVNELQDLHGLLQFHVDKNGQIPPHLAPRLRIHPDCVNLVRTLPALPVDPKNPSDVDTTAEDHLYDALRYGLSMRSPSSVASVARDVPSDRHPGLTNKGKRLSRYGWEKQSQPTGRWSRPDADPQMNLDDYL